MVGRKVKDSDWQAASGGAPRTLLGWADLQLKLEALFGRRVDLVSRGAIERSQNPYRRNAILASAAPIYVEG